MSLDNPSGSTTINTGDLEIGAVEIKNGTDDTRATVDPTYGLAVDVKRIQSEIDSTASGTITTQNLVPTGTATAGSSVSISLNGEGTVTIQVTGTYTGALSGQITVDGTNWITLAAATTLARMSTGVPAATIASGVQDIFQVDVSGYAQFRITGLAAMTGTATISLRASNVASSVYLSGSIPAGTAAIGTVDTELPAAGVPANGAAYPTAPKVVAIMMGDNGATNDMLQLDAYKSLKTVYPDLAIASASVSSAATIFTQDVSGWESCAIQVTSAGSGCTITYEGSNDNSTWNSITGYNTASAGNSGLTSTSTTAMIFVFNATARYIRARVSTYGSGTVTASGYLRASPVPILVSPPAADSAAAQGNPLIVGGKVRTAADTTFIAGDAQTTTQTTAMQTLVKVGGLPETDWKYVAASGGITDTNAVVLKAAGAASVKNYLTSIYVKNASAVATEISILDNVTVIWRGHLSASATTGETIHFPSPLASSAATALNFSCATNATITYVNAQGYQAF